MARPGTMTEEQFQNALKDIVMSINNGWIDDDEANRRLNIIGATDEDLERMM